MHCDSFKLRDWNSRLPDRFAMQKFRSNVLDTAVLINGAETANGLDLAHEVLSDEHYPTKGQQNS